MKRCLAIVPLAAAALLAVSCASTPQKPAPEQPQPAVEQKPAPQAPEAERARAHDLQKSIDEHALAEFAPDAYQAAVKDRAAADAAYGTDNETARASYDSSIAGFTAVMDAGWPQRLTALKTDADAARAAADEVKAGVAVKDQYGTADAAYQRAERERDAGDREAAYKDFSDARAGFTDAAAAAQVKKAAAMQSIQEARNDLGASEQKASDAQQSLSNEGITMTEQAQ
jgi:colicin import membrane protein